jgi:hypothetical protein
LVAVNALVVGGVEGAGFFWLKRKIAEAFSSSSNTFVSSDMV